MEQNVFQRSKYSERQRLTAGDLENQQAYDSGKRRLLNRALHGMGVVYGLTARYLPARAGVLVGAGLALDALGRELFLPEEAFISTAELFARQPPAADGWTLCIRLDERECGEGRLLLPDGTHAVLPNRIEEGVRLLAVRHPGADEVRLARLSPVWGADGAPSLTAVEPLAAALVRPHRGETLHSGIILLSGEGDTLYSEEVSHGLGAGNVQVTLSVGGWEQGRRCAVSGASELFHTGLRTAAELFPDSGTFIAAARVKGGYRGRLALRWYAQRAEDAWERERIPDAPAYPVPEPPRAARETEPPALWGRLHLEPRTALLRPGERVAFRPCTADGLPCLLELNFAVRDGGGTIDGGGLYTAPEREGAYQIRASVQGDPGKWLEASAMVLDAAAALGKRGGGA